MKKDLSEIVCILDRSGSMSSIINDAIGGFNSLLESQKKEKGEATMTVSLFDDVCDVIHDNVNIKDVNPLDNSTYVPRGSTALYDAIGRTLVSVGQRLANTPEDQRPENVVVAILTDGEENASKEYHAAKIKDMIKEQEDKYSWKFIYLAANQNAFDVGSKIGFGLGNSVTFAATSKGTRDAYSTMNLYSSSVRSGRNVSNFVQDNPIGEESRYDI